MKKIVTILIVVACMATKFVDILQSLGINKTEAEQNIWEVLAEKAFISQDKEAIVKKARKLSTDMQVKGVKELFAISKEYFNSTDFLASYKKKREEQEAAMLESMPQLTKAQLQQQIKESKAQGIEIDYYPENSKELIKDRLKYFIELSSTVDFSAKTQGSRKTFVNPEYEEKPSDWKMCYRAGKEVIEAARQEAQRWLNEMH